jgi:hypothetical protein
MRVTMRIGRRSARAAATAVVTGLVAMGAAACQPAPVPPRPPTPLPPITTSTTTTVPAAPAPTELEITYRDGTGRRPFTYTVRCGPGAAASITPALRVLDARRACATVAAERTLLVDGPPQGRYCTAQYHGPETARVTGHIDDDPVDQTFRRGNGCVEGDWRRVGDLVLRPMPIRQIS